jgi:hypothetical protein
MSRVLDSALQDRATAVPRVHGRDDIMFFGIFDGTVGDFASDTVHLTIAENICNSKVCGSARTQITRLSCCG